MKKNDNLSNLSKHNDPLDIFYGTIKNRMSNSFTASYIISLLALNWKLLIFLVASNKEIENKFIYIYESLYPSIVSEIKMFFLWPIIIALVYSFIIPWLTEIIESINNKYLMNVQVREQSKMECFLKNNIENSRLLAKAELAKANVESSEDFNEKISSLETNLKENKETIQKLTLEKESEFKEKQVLNKKLIELTSNKENSDTENELLKVYLKSILEKTLLLYSNTGKINENDIYPLINEIMLKDERFGLELIEVIKQSLEKVYLYKVEISPVEAKTSVEDTINGIFNVKWHDYEKSVYSFTTTHTSEKELNERVEHLRTLPYIKSVKAELFNG